jgi:hypothetical protein
VDVPKPLNTWTIFGCFFLSIGGFIATQIASTAPAIAPWTRHQQQVILGEIERVETSAPAPAAAARDLMVPPAVQQRCFARTGANNAVSWQTIVKTASWRGGELQLEFEEPFEILRGSNRKHKERNVERARWARLWNLAPRDVHRSEHTNGEFSKGRFLHPVKQHWNFGFASRCVIQGNGSRIRLVPQTQPSS